MEISKEISSCYQALFNHLNQEYDLILTISEMDDIIRESFNVVAKFNSGKCMLMESAPPKKEKKKDEMHPDAELVVNEVKALFDPKYITNSTSKELSRLLKTYPKESIIKAIKWAKSDSFWSTNFLSISKLNSVNKEKVKYIDVFLSKCGGSQIIVKSEPIKTYRDKINDELSRVSNNQQLKIKEANVPEY